MDFIIYNGTNFLKYLAKDIQLQERDKDSHGGSGCSWEDDNTLQAKARRDSDHNTHYRLQRRAGGVQEYRVQCMGHRRTGQDPTSLAVLLPKLKRDNFRSGQ